jgi:crotonobetainyl-CoA:carnitine CoA-transferase CaiB-like acyl-CoA transferase
MPMLRSHLAAYSAAELSAVFEQHELPFAPITKPQELFDDPHLNATGGLAPIRMNDGSMSKVPLMPFTLGGERPGIRIQPPLLGEHTSALLKEVGYSDQQIAEMKKQNITTGD